MKTIFAQNLRKYRKIRSMTQKALAKELHYSHTAIANYESGRNEPSLSDLCRLADILGVSTDALLGREGLEYKEMSNPFLEQFMQLEPKMPEDYLRTGFSAVMGNGGSPDKNKTSGI